MKHAAVNAWFSLLSNVILQLNLVDGWLYPTAKVLMYYKQINRKEEKK